MRSQEVMNFNGVALVQSVLLVELVNLMTKVKLPQRSREPRGKITLSVLPLGKKAVCSYIS
jgi:hypothetical protein